MNHTPLMASTGHWTAHSLLRQSVTNVHLAVNGNPHSNGAYLECHHQDGSSIWAPQHQQLQQQQLHQQHSTTSVLNLLSTTPDTTIGSYRSAFLDLENTTATLVGDKSSLWLVSEWFAGPLRNADKHVDYYVNELWVKYCDERVLKLPFMSDGPWKLLLAIMLYVLFVKRWGPLCMANRRPFELNWALRVYNLAMVATNVWICYHACRILNFGIDCFDCDIIDPHDISAEALELLRFGWLFFWSRLIEWIDTGFFVLRKKQTQITKLHVFHHSFVPILVWLYLKLHPSKTVAFFPLVNSFVHTIMYTYYLLATFGPKMAPYLWWKKYLTSLQILQFVIIIIQVMTIPLRETPQCQYPRLFFWIALAGAILFLTLFYRYYVDTYNNKSEKYQSHRTNDNNNKVNARDKLEKLPLTKIANSDTTMTALLELSNSGRSRSLSEYVENCIDDADLRKQRTIAPWISSYSA